MSVIINPGSGPVENASVDNARLCMEQFARDVGQGAEWWGVGVDQGDGRFAFFLGGNGRKVEVEMPGLPIEQIHYLGPPQSIFDFPRLYVEGSSWVWCYGIDIARRALFGEREEET